MAPKGHAHEASAPSGCSPRRRTRLCHGGHPTRAPHDHRRQYAIPSRPARQIQRERPTVYVLPDRAAVPRQLRSRRLFARRRRSGRVARTDLSLYFHIPFCDTVCFYCGCNKVATKNRAHARPYLDRLKREIALQAACFDTAAPGVATALGRRHADLPVARRNGRTDGRDARALQVAARCRSRISRSKSTRAKRRRETDRASALARLQPDEPRRAGFRSRRAAGDQPHPAARDDARP